MIGASQENIGARLQERRDAMGLSGTEVAKRARISATTLYAIENGKTQPRGATLRRLARAFDVTEEELKTGTPKADRAALRKSAEEWQRTKAEQYEAELLRLRAESERDFERWLGLNARADFMREHAASGNLRERFGSVAAVAYDRAEHLFMRPEEAPAALEEKEAVGAT